jgi:hypothetical protein
MKPPEEMRVIRAWKLFRIRRNGTLGPLFINRKLVVKEGEWFPAEDHPTKGYARRPGWHCAPQPYAPHLKVDAKTGQRIWVEVEIADFADLVRPEVQGGTWYLANWLRVIPRQTT